MPQFGRIHIIPHPKAEPDLDQVVLAVLAMLDEEQRAAVVDLDTETTSDAEPIAPERKAS